MPNQDQLRSTLERLDNASYKAYKEIKGVYDFIDFKLIIDYVQGDPFASPSRFRVQIPQSIAAFPEFLFHSLSREIALRDYLTRQFIKVASKMSQSRGTGKSGLIATTGVGQEVLERTSVLIDEEMVEVRFIAGLPAKGRRILGRQAAEMLCDEVPEIVDQALIYQSLSPKAIRRHVETIEDADWLREQLSQRNLVAFVPNGAILPRRSGVDDRPLADQNVVPFESPAELQVSFDCPNGGTVEGMGIPQGITLIVGGGYHGKSTLLQALELGIYNHVPGDGRELVVTNPDAVKIRAEDGRNVVGVDISPFINQLPQGRSTSDFSSPNASGSTSQAANIVEALEVGAKVLMVDEDTAATNFMIRDRRMQQLISKDKEPITPFIDKIQQLYQDYEVSTILVMGGSGDYFDMANTVIAMENFRPYEVTAKAKEIAESNRTERNIEGGDRFGKITPRIPLASSIDPSRGKKEVDVKVRDNDEVSFGNEDIDLAAVEQLVDQGQLRAIAAGIVYAKKQYLDGKRTLPEVLDLVFSDLDQKGLDVITPSPQHDLAYFRRFELAAALNRLRTLSVKN
ncbi:MAG: ABC-ATPase domain-containing protein [Halothece sp.]